MQLLQKEYFEDIDEAVGQAYRYWELLLEIDGRRFGVRIYTDEPHTAYAPVAPRPVDDEQHADLRALARYVAEHEGGARLFVLGDRGGYDELETVIAQKQARA